MEYLQNFIIKHRIITLIIGLCFIGLGLALTGKDKFIIKASIIAFISIAIGISLMLLIVMTYIANKNAQGILFIKCFLAPYVFLVISIMVRSLNVSYSQILNIVLSLITFHALFRNELFKSK